MKTCILRKDLKLSFNQNARNVTLEQLKGLQEVIMKLWFQSRWWVKKYQLKLLVTLKSKVKNDHKFN